MKLPKLNDTKPKLVCRILLLLMIVSTVGFAYVNSIMPPAVSEQQSGTVGEIISQIIPPTTPLGSFVQQYLRKIAHFTEYGLLGAELAIYVIFFTENKKKWVPVSILFAFFVGFIDETIQVFSNRGPSVMDVWLDFAGCLTYSALTYAVAAVIYLVLSRIRRRTAERKEMEKSQNG